MSTVATYTTSIIVGESYQALSRETTSPKGVQWDYPYGEGTATVLAVTAPGEDSEWGLLPWRAVWFSLEGTVQALPPATFLRSFQRS